MEALQIRMVDAPCDRCGKVAAELLPFKLSETIHYRRRTIEKPWLCKPCFVAEKEKWWKNHPAGTLVNMSERQK